MNLGLKIKFFKVDPNSTRYGGRERCVFRVPVLFFSFSKEHHHKICMCFLLGSFFAPACKTCVRSSSFLFLMRSWTTVLDAHPYHPWLIDLLAGCCNSVSQTSPGMHRTQVCSSYSPYPRMPPEWKIIHMHHVHSSFSISLCLV